MKRFIAALIVLAAVGSLQAQSWQYTGSMNAVHWLSEMTALDNHTVLIVGGFDESMRVLSTCEIYDPATASWTRTGSLNVARSYPTIVKLSNGHVLSMCGGIQYGTAAATGTVEDYDPATGTWTTVGQLVQPRFVPTATLMNNGKILVAGGMTPMAGTTNSCEIYDPATGTSTLVASMNTARATHQATLMTDGRVLISGGRDGGAYSNYFDQCEVFDPAAGTWTLIGAMKTTRTMGVLACFSDNTVIAAGGRNSSTTLATGSELLDPTTMTWQSTDPIKEPVHWTAGVLFPDDRLMAVGGIVDGTMEDPSGLSVITTPKCEWYDRSLKQWYYAPQMNLSRCRNNAVYFTQTSNTGLPSACVLVAGGQMGDKSLDTAGFHQYVEGFTNTAEILDVTPGALKAYMKMPINASVKYSDVNTDGFAGYYESDGSIKLVWTLAATEDIRIELMSLDGATVRQYANGASTAGQHSLEVPTAGLATGTYFLHYTSATTNRMFKFTVQ